MTDPDPLAWLDGSLEEIGERFAQAADAWKRHQSRPLEDEEAAAVHATLLAAQQASLRWCLAALRREGVEEKALAPLVTMVGSLDRFIKGKSDKILVPVARPAPEGSSGNGTPGASGSQHFVRLMAIYATRLLIERKILKRQAAARWVASTLSAAGFARKSKTIGDWRRNPEDYLPPELHETLQSLLESVPFMPDEALRMRLRQDLRSAVVHAELPTYR